MRQWPRSPVEGGAERQKVRLEAGSYHARIGFRPFGKFESNWFSGATNRREAQYRPFHIDADNPLVSSFGERLLAGLPDVNDPRFVTELDKRYSSLLPSAPLSKEENYSMLSDVVREGSGTCAAKTLLLGTLLSRRYPELKLSEIYGQVGVVRDRVSYPFEHEWLRAESDELVFLYDSMYSRTTCLRKEGGSFIPLDDGIDTFRNYSVEAYPVSALYRHAPFTRLSGNIKLVDSYDGSSKSFFLLPDAGLEAQADGAINFAFDTDRESELELVNGHLESRTSLGAALYYPIDSLQREDN